MSNNLQKTPKSTQLYYDVLLTVDGQPRVFENEENVLLLTIGYAETTWKIIQRFKNSKNIYVVDRESECDWLKEFCDLHKIENVTFIPISEESEVLSIFDNKELSNKEDMLVIANPPYGKRGTLSTTIIKAVLPRVEEIVCLCQLRSIEKNGVYQHVVKAKIVENIFDAGLGDLAVSLIRNDYTEGKQVTYGKRDICEEDIEWWIRDFNKDKKNLWRTIPHCACSPEKYKKIVEEKKSFFIVGCFEFSNPITKGGNSTGYRYNVYKEPVIWAGEVDPKHPEKGPLKNGKDCYAFDCESERAKNNFIAVYYEVPKVGFYSQRNLQKREYSSGQSYAKDIVPSIDWEHLDESSLWETSKENAFLVELIKEGGQKIVIAYLKARWDSSLSYDATNEEITKELKAKAGLESPMD